MAVAYELLADPPGGEGVSSMAGKWYTAGWRSRGAEGNIDAKHDGHECRKCAGPRKRGIQTGA